MNGIRNLLIDVYYFKFKYINRVDEKGYIKKARKQAVFGPF
jgi:hypothetical protein